MIIDEIKNYKAGSPQRIIGEYLMSREDIQGNLQKENKSLKECISYIIQQAEKLAENRCAFMTDEQVYGLAVHYYDEDDIEVDKVAGCNVVVNHVVELSEEEKKQARQEAIKQYRQEELIKLQKRNERPKRTERTETTSSTQPQPTLFDTLAL